MENLYKSPRPFSVSLLTWIVLILSLVNMVRFVQSIQHWEFLTEILPISPAYLSISGFTWCMIGLPLVWGMWRGRAWAPRFTWLAILGYSSYYWLERLLLSGYAERNSNWPFALGVNLFLLAWSSWVLFRQKARTFFGDIHERRSKNPKIA